MAKGQPVAAYGQGRLGEARQAACLFIVEGESDCWSLWRHGWPSLGIPGAHSVNALQPDHIEGLREIYIHVEPDQGGRTFLAKVPARLKELGFAGAAYALRLPEGMKDASDLHAQHADSFNDYLGTAIRAATPIDLALHKSNGRHIARDPAPDIAAAGPTESSDSGQQPANTAALVETLTDVGNAQRLVRLHGTDLRHCHPWGKDFVWAGTHWREDDTAQIERWAKDAVRQMYGEAAACSEEHQRRMLATHATKSEGAKAIRNMIDMARSEPGIPVLPNQLDAKPYQLNCLNGTIDLADGKLRPHRREALLTKVAPVEYDTNAKCPLWDKFLADIMDGNPDLGQYLQRAVGYSLTGDVREQCLFFLHGAGANGKSTFLDVVMAMLGDYACQAVAELLMVRQGESHPTERADLFGRRFVSCIETEDGKRIAEALLKQLTGGDRIRARKMRQDFWEFSPTHKLFLAANHKPIVRGIDHAVWRRIKLVPFTVTFSGERRDKNLPAKLKAELPGILAWAVRGCLDWQKYGLGEPDEVRQATGEYRNEMDVVARFIEDCCAAHPELRVATKVLYPGYLRWCESGGEKPLTRDAFGRQLKERGFDNRRSGAGGATVWHGIGLRDSEEP